MNIFAIARKFIIYPTSIIVGLCFILFLIIVLRVINVNVKSIQFDDFTFHLQKYPFKYERRYRILECYNNYGCGWRDSIPVMYARKIYDIVNYKNILFVSIPKKSNYEITDFVKKLGEQVYSDGVIKIIIEYK